MRLHSTCNPIELNPVMLLGQFPFEQLFHLDEKLLKQIHTANSQKVEGSIDSWTIQYEPFSLQINCHCDCFLFHVMLLILSSWASVDL